MTARREFSGMPTRAPRFFQYIATLGLALVATAPVAADTVSTLRIRLHPYAAAPGTLPLDTLVKLQAVAGMTFALTGTTRTGALELAVGQSLDEATLASVMKRLRSDRSVLWVEPVRTNAISNKAATVRPPYANVPGQRLLVRLKDGVVPDWGTLLPRLSARIGADLKAERSIGDVWVLSVGTPQMPAQLAQMAQSLQQDGDVQYADPVKRAVATAAPNDPLYPRQWSLSDPLSGVNAESAWTLQPSSSSIVVAVIDTGILPHPDLEGRVLAGYDFISDPGSARDGDARDANPRDEGTWGSAGECGFAEDSFFHGLFVAGQIAANSNNGIGIAGLTTGAKILPVRVLGKCSEGTFDDILAAMLWSSGVAIANVPPNPNPAKVINLSLGGFGACDQSVQAAIDDALAQGSVVVAAAGNESADVQDFAPANCSGVIAVAAHTRTATLTSYSNFGRGVSLSAPGGDLPLDGLIVSTSNDGTTIPQNPSYVAAAGTSFAAPLVSGTAALMLARNPLLAPGRVFDIVTGTTRDFPVGSLCSQPGVCGSGMLDTGAAVASTFPGTTTPPAGTYPVVEYYRADLDHYFITATPAEVNYVDTYLSGIFQRTGYYFYAYLSPFDAPAGARPVCRFYAGADVQINSHYYTADANECQFVLTRWPGIWNLETAAAFYIQVPDTDGVCPDGTLPVYRFFNNRRDANHRYTVDLSVRRAMINRGWVPEGNGPNSDVFCSRF
jgi:serine protease